MTPTPFSTFDQFCDTSFFNIFGFKNWVIGCLARPVLKVSIKIECQEINQSIVLKHKECQ